MVLGEVVTVEPSGVRVLHELEVLVIDLRRRLILPLHLVEQADREGHVQDG